MIMANVIIQMSAGSGWELKQQSMRLPAENGRGLKWFFGRMDSRLSRRGVNLNDFAEHVQKTRTGSGDDSRPLFF